MSARHIAKGALIACLGFSVPVWAAASVSWWQAPGSLSHYDARWRRAYVAHKENANAFADALARSLKTGKGFAYLKQGGVSPSWYRPPLRVSLYPAPYNGPFYRLAFRAFVQTHRLIQAYRLALTAVSLRPLGALWRHRLIRVATWLGQREQVLRQEQWFFRHGDHKALAKVILLASSLARPDIVIRDLARPGARAQLDTGEWKILLGAYDELGEPHHAVAEIERALRIRPNRYLLKEEAYFDDQMGVFGQSVAALRELSLVYGTTPRIALREARLLAYEGHPDQALRAMQASQGQATLNDVPFWHLYAVLAWDTDNARETLYAEKTLYLLGAAGQYDLQRLIAVTRHRVPAAALAVALQAWREFHLSIFFFEGASLAVQEANWSALARLLKSVPARKARHLRQYASYWIAAAALSAETHHPQVAAAAYAQALTLDGGDPVIGQDLVWTLIDHRQVADLRALLAVHVRFGKQLSQAVANATQVAHERGSLQGPRKSSSLPSTLSRADQLGQRGLPRSAWALRKMVIRRATEELLRHSAGRAVP